LLPIYPIAVFSFEYPLRPQRQQHEVTFPDLKVLDFQFAAIQLNQLNWRDFLQQRNPVAAALMAKMRIARPDRPRVKAECLRILATLQLDPARVEMISGFVDTYLRLNATEETLFQAEIDKMGLGEQEQIMEIVTSWMERGIEQGREQGIEQGREREVALILRLLTRRLNGLNASLAERVRRLSLEQVEALGEALLDFSSEADLVNWLAQIE
jgi:flagellar biosynthesis/type III secretory pathway protein FliH